MYVYSTRLYAYLRSPTLCIYSQMFFLSMFTLHVLILCRFTLHLFTKGLHCICVTQHSFSLRGFTFHMFTSVSVLILKFILHTFLYVALLCVYFLYGALHIFTCLHVWSSLDKDLHIYTSLCSFTLWMFALQGFRHINIAIFHMFAVCYVYLRGFTLHMFCSTRLYAYSHSFAMHMFALQGFRHIYVALLHICLLYKALRIFT